MNRSLEYILRRAIKGERVVIFGAGFRGKELLEHLIKDVSISVAAFFDNDETLEGSSIKSIKVRKPCRMEDENCMYVIAVDTAALRQELRNQLQELGIQKDEIVTYYYCRDYDYMSSLNEEHYRDELDEIYYECFGKRMNWQQPVTYNEIINWEKFNIKDERRTLLADKYLVREWVKERIGEQYLTKSYGVWDNAYEIDFDSLPNAFVLKVNNGSTRNIVVKNKAEIDRDEVCRQLNEWKDKNFAFVSFELHYKNIVPKIICEEYLEGMAENVYDYNIYCFHGEPEYIWCIKGSHMPDCQASFYDKDWNMQPFSYGYPKDPVLAPKPGKLDKMLELSRVLCQDFEHVRVDWYNMPDGRVLFGEMTFSTWSGLMHFVPEEYDGVFGKLIKTGE